MEYGSDSGPSSLPALGKKDKVLISAVVWKETGEDKTTQAVGGDRPRSSSLRGALALSTGISPYLLQMLTRAPFATRSWN